MRIFDSSIPHVTYDLSDPWLGHEEWYNGTCRYLHLVPTGGEGIGAIRSLQTPLILDGFEGIWTIIVTMTTVGYGGRFPKTTSGKFIVIVAAILGAFYLAMPLSILATQFNQNFQKREDVSR